MGTVRTNNSERIEMDKLRVIQWNTGKVGKLALRAMLDDPRLELVGVYAHSPDKVGKDAGELCGRPGRTGVAATDDIDALIALGADSVLYTPFEGNVDHAVRLLEAGMDVVSTNLFLHSAASRARCASGSRRPARRAAARSTSPASTPAGSTRSPRR